MLGSAKSQRLFSQTGTQAVVCASIFLVVCLGFPGCVELGLVPGPDRGDGTTPDGWNGEGNGSNGVVVPAVRLAVSNPTPQLNEEIVLTCSLTNNAPGEVEFDFQTASGVRARLRIDRVTGSARYIIQDSDLGVANSFTCTASTPAGTSIPSDSVFVVASATSSPP